MRLTHADPGLTASDLSTTDWRVALVTQLERIADALEEIAYEMVSQKKEAATDEEIWQSLKKPTQQDAP